jgi:hypothetical protein
MSSLRELHLNHNTAARQKIGSGGQEIGKDKGAPCPLAESSSGRQKAIFLTGLSSYVNLCQELVVTTCNQL